MSFLGDVIRNPQVLKQTTTTSCHVKFNAFTILVWRMLAWQHLHKAQNINECKY